MSKKRIFILGSFILVLSISFFVFWIIEKKKESIQESPLEFTEEDCRLLLLEKDPSISEMYFEEGKVNYHIDSSESQEPVIWKISISENFQDTSSRKIVFFVSSDIFEGCGIVLDGIITEDRIKEIPIDYERFKCGIDGEIWDTEFWLDHKKDSKYVYVHSITRAPKKQSEAVYYYSNINKYGEKILESSYEKLKNDCQKL